MEVSLNYHESAPACIPVGKSIFYQVLINLILDTIKSINGRGWIKINSFKKVEDGQSYLSIEFDASQFQLSKQKAINTTNLAQEKDLIKIMRSDIELSYKVVKIICSQLSWKVVCEPFKICRYSLLIPLRKEDLEADY